MDGDNKENLPGNEPKQAIVTEKLFGQCFELQKLEDNALIPVGGGSIFSDETNINVVGDFENLQNTLQEMHDSASKYNLPELKKWLESQGIEIDEKLFATLFAFQKILGKRYPINQEGQPAREQSYTQAKRKEVKLSELFASNTAACAEIAALAQYYLQHEGVTSKFFSGDVLWDKQHEFSEKHSFIVIPLEDQTYIFDPANPTATTQGVFPSIWVTKPSFDEEVRKGQKRFVTATNILSKKEAFYGVNNGTNVSEANVV